LIPTLLELSDVFWDIVLLRSGSIHKRAQVHCEDEVALTLVHGLETKPHAIRGRASVGVYFLHRRYIACDEQLGKCVIVSPVLSTLRVILWVWASDLAHNILPDAKQLE